MPSPNARPVVLDPVHPNAGIAAAYRLKLDSLIEPMAAEILAAVRKVYRGNKPEMAQDESSAMAFRRSMRRLSRKWQRQFDEAAPDLARHFSVTAADRSDRALAQILRKAGFTVKFKLTAGMNDVVQSSIGENVALIRSIPAQHFTQVEGMVMRSVAAGRDLAPLAADLEQQYGVTKRRAALIARDQNNKATATVARTRQIELGITEAVWLHSAGGKEPRPSHVAYSGKRYDVREGALIDGQRIFPGQLINCRCVSKSVVPGFG